MSAAELIVRYQLVAELLLHPHERDAAGVAALRARLPAGPHATGEPILAFLEHSLAACPDEYVQTLELSPPCPLYLGAYLFDEPTSCRGAGMSDRNAYMLDLVGIYGHFGFKPSGRELPDYLPLLVEFLAISLDHAERDRIGLRRRLLERYVLPGLEPLRARLEKYQSPYELLAAALLAVVQADLAQIGDTPAWHPPAQAAAHRGALPVLAGTNIHKGTRPSAAVCAGDGPPSGSGACVK